MDVICEFDKFGKAIPNKALRKEFFRLVNHSNYTNHYRGSLLAVQDTVNDDVYLATFLEYSSITHMHEPDEIDKYKILVHCGDEPIWVDRDRCASILPRLKDYLYEAFPNLMYINNKHILQQ